MQFGRRSEKLDLDQLALALEDLEQAVAEADAETEKDDPPLRRSGRRERRQSRGAPPEHLPRIEVVIEPATTICPCCAGAMRLIGEDRSERLDVIPMRWQVVVTRRPKYGCRACQSAVVQAPAPARLIEGGLPTERMVAHVLVAKYADQNSSAQVGQSSLSQPLRIVRMWLEAGVLESDEWHETEQGTPQGAGISPLPANIFLHDVLDLRVHRWRRRQARGRVSIVRYADDFVMGFEREADARQMLVDLAKRLARFGLSLHADKTRLIEFGRRPAMARRERGERHPETFAFLGFTRYCGWTRVSTG